MGIWWIITAGVLVVDQFTKLLIVNTLNIGASIPVFPGFFYITHTQNPGAAFGIFAYRTNLFIIITLILAIIIITLMIKLNKKYYLLKLGLALQLGGALGNFIDRLRTGYVVDFLDFNFWPIFNVADIAIVVGVVILLVFIIKEPDKKEGEENVL